MLECVVNVSEGSNPITLGHLTDRVTSSLLDLHTDPIHNRSVFTLAGDAVEQAARELALGAVELLDIGSHRGVHPRLGVVDVVPFVPLSASPDLTEALAARGRFVDWFTGMGVPCFEYGPEISLPAVRRRAWIDLTPTRGPSQPHATAGACCVGARTYLVAYNVWLREGPSTARAIAREVRSAHLRSLGLDMAGKGQVAFNLVSPLEAGPELAYDLVKERAEVDRAELVGLIPRAVLERVPASRWAELDLDPSRTIEARLGGLPVGPT